MQLEIEDFFKSESLVECPVRNTNPFNGFLIDFEFLFLKKNYSFKIKEHSKKSSESSFFGGYFNKSKQKIKTKDMRGMVTSTIFTLNQSEVGSSTSSGSTRSRALSKLNIVQEKELTDEEKIPFLLDFIIKYSKE
jgi:hypothetical protein